MTRKDYILIAEAIADTKALSPDAVAMRADIATTLARKLAADNPRFDMARFFAACGVL